jgi:hypothetical protein
MAGVRTSKGGSIAAIIHMSWMLFELHRKVSYPIGELISSLVRTSLADLGGMLAGYAARWALAGWVHGLGPHGKLAAALGALLTITAVMTAGGIVFLGLARQLRCEEMDDALRIIFRRRAARTAPVQAPAAQEEQS